MWLIYIWRWILFRLMFGAGLIKLRGDSCWRDLTCLNYYFETQPMPNPLSWYFHWLPHSIHTGGVVFNHFAEVIVPFAYFAPQPFASIAGVITILFQGVLIVSGNLSWLNWLTVVLAIPLISDKWLSWLPVHPPANFSADPAFPMVMYVVAGLVALMSIGPVMNMIDRLRAHGTHRITLLISHRFSTVRMADWIVVLHAGAVVEAGGHEQLLALHGIYATLFNLQARGYVGKEV